MSAQILLVDDEIDFLDLMRELMEEVGYGVTTASNAYDALSLLQENNFDLLISDINMPGMKGFELLETSARLCPDLKRILITAYDVSDYLYLAKNYNIGNIITKTIPFNFKEIQSLLDTLLCETIFGLNLYLSGPLHSVTVQSDNDIEKVNKTILKSIADSRHRRLFQHALGEIIVNAVFYGARSERGDKKHTWKTNVVLEKNEVIDIKWGSDHEKTGISVTDQKGRLSKKDILYWLERNNTRKNDGLLKGLSDNHGKGIYVTWGFVDRLIINIDPNKKTEVIMINYHSDLYDCHKPLWIQEL